MRDWLCFWNRPICWMYRKKSTIIVPFLRQNPSIRKPIHTPLWGTSSVICLLVRGQGYLQWICFVSFGGEWWLVCSLHGYHLVVLAKNQSLHLFHQCSASISCRGTSPWILCWFKNVAMMLHVSFYKMKPHHMSLPHLFSSRWYNYW